MTSKPLL